MPASIVRLAAVGTIISAVMLALRGIRTNPAASAVGSHAELHGGIARPLLRSHTFPVPDYRSKHVADIAGGLVIHSHAELCQNSHPQLRTCSHQADANEVGGTSSTVESLQSLWHMGITCFDMDILITSDGVLLVGHPQHLQNLLDKEAPPDVGRSPEKYTHAQIVSWGGTEKHVPLLETFMMRFASLIEELPGTQTLQHQPNLASDPVMLLEFKGAAFGIGSVLDSLEMARRANVLQHLMIWFLESPLADEVLLKAREASSTVSFLRGFLDRLPDGTPKTVFPDITNAMRDKYQAVGPSLKVPDHLFTDAKAVGFPTIGWVANDAQGLQRAVQVGADIVISNFPIEIMSMLKSVTNQCMGIAHTRNMA